MNSTIRAKAPECPKRNHEEDWFGHTVTDPYYWLRDPSDPQAAEWVRKENEYTDRWFDAKELADRISSLKANQTKPLWQEIYPWKDGYAAVRIENGNEQLYRLNDSFEAVSRLFEDGVDTNYTAIEAIPCPSNSNYLLIMGWYDNDARFTPLVVDCSTGKILKKIPDIFYAAWFTDEPTVYIPATIADPATQESVIRMMTCNVETGEETVLTSAQGVVGDIRKSSDGKHTMLEIWKDYTVSYFYSYDESTGKLTDITCGTAIEMKYADTIGDTHYFVCKEFEPVGEILAIEEGSNIHDSRKVLSAGKATVDNAFAIGKELFALITENVCYRLIRVRDSKAEEIELPGTTGTARVTGRTENEVFIRYESFTEKPMLLSFDGGRAEIIARSGDAASDEITVEQKWAPSVDDGTAIPYFVVRKKDAIPDGTNPTWIYAYGGYNCSEYPCSKEPVASMNVSEWVMKGGIYVLANIRGGSEFGALWHEEGMGMKKKNCYYDFIGVTEQLIADRWTAPEHIVISGYSNGGLLMSALVTMRPDLFGCVIDSVPHTDMIHFAEDDRGPMYITEYGNPRESRESFEYLMSYSPFHNIRETDYPAVYIQTGECDNNVPPYHGKKFAAKMQEMNQSENPVLLRVLKDGGHDRGSGEVFWQTAAEMQLFVEKALML